MKYLSCLFFILIMMFLLFTDLFADVDLWKMFEQDFTSIKEYANPLYDVKEFNVTFKSPTGRVKKINGFWDGETNWKVRFCPDEIGIWTFSTSCSDEENTGLNDISGTFDCINQSGNLEIYTKGEITHPRGTYYLTYSDGTPFFWTACTAWNGALLSTEKEWDTYLQHRSEHGYTVIQFVTTQWRGCAANSRGQVAFEGSGYITLNVDFFKHLDSKVKRINDYGLVAAPVLLWALPFGQGMELSPGYYLPVREAVLLARYMVARYGGYHVIWILGGDGKYIDEFEQRWKNIGRGVFDDEHPGLVTMHPMGRSWTGDAFADEDWLDIIGYQSSHSNSRRTVDWINKGPMANEWYKLIPRPIINMEPNYEQIGFRITDTDVRNACYWSIFATPIAGITYGANGIWPWLREGEKILNHRHDPGTSTWRESIDFPGSIQIGYLAQFIKKLKWWRLKPAPELLVEQPGDKQFNHFISVVKTENNDLILAYVPVKSTFSLYNTQRLEYTGQWFDPVSNKYSKAEINCKDGLLEITSPNDADLILILKKK